MKKIVVNLLHNAYRYDQHTINTIYINKLMIMIHTQVYIKSQIS